MVVVVSNQNDVHIAIQRLTNLGYAHEGDLMGNRLGGFFPPNNVPWHHLYICTVVNAEYKRHILSEIT